MKLIIADDSPLFREKIRSLVLPFTSVEIVGEAGNGNEALRLIDINNPDFVIFNIRMPEMNGIELLKQIKKRSHRTVACILTNYTYRQYREKCLAEGADYIYNKSEDFDKIKLAIGETLSKRIRPTNRVLLQ